MKQFTRRSILKQMANATVLAASVPLFSLLGCRSKETKITLNVVLHGLFVLNIIDSCIELLTPIVDMHKYRAGIWDKDGYFDLLQGESYRLAGVDERELPPEYESDCVLELSQSTRDFTVHPERSYYTMQLPFPERIHFLRCVRGCPYGAPCLHPAPRTNPIEIYKLSLCTVLTYPVSDHRNLELIGKGTNWKPVVDDKTSTTNLHLWAEPEERLTQKHAEEAYSHLSELLYPLQLTLKTDKTAPLDPDTGIRGLSSEEEQGWSEWQGGGEGSYPTNCCGPITTK